MDNVSSVLLEIAYFVGLFLFPMWAGWARAKVTDRDIPNLDAFYRSIVSGFLGFCIVGWVAGSDAAFSGSYIRYLCLSGLIGVGGKEADQLVTLFYTQVKKMMGIANGPTEK